MKKSLYFIMFILVTFSSCAIVYEALSYAHKEQEDIVAVGEMQLSLDHAENQSKEDAIPVSYMEVTNDEVTEGSMIIVEGEVDLLLTVDEDYTQFSLSVYEEHGYGVYVIQDESGKEFKEGDTVRVYGNYEGDFQFAPIPIVYATDIEVKN